MPGKKFGADRPQEHLEVKEVNVVSSGVCGDIMHLHGLEDEFLGMETWTEFCNEAAHLQSNPVTILHQIGINLFSI